jgi:hypothetical protein
VFNYDPDLSRDELELQVAPNELYEAFENMRYRLDPFLSMQQKSAEENMKQLEVTRNVLSVLPPEMQAKAVAMATDADGNLKI